MLSQIPDTIARALLPALAFLLLAGGVQGSGHPAGQDLHTGPEQILDAARQFLDHFAGAQETEGFQVTAEPGRLDPRLRLAHCEAPLALEFTGDPWRSTQPNLQVSCQGERPWRMYLSVSLEIRGPALVAARPISRGERVQPSMVDQKTVVVNALRRGSITRMDQLTGMEMRRPVNAGTVFTPDLVAAPDAVARGDHVIITARSGQFSVSARGKALANAGIGEQVLIENLTSSRRVRARVTGPGQVEIPM